MWRPFLGAYVVAWTEELDAAVRRTLSEDWESADMWSRVLARQYDWLAREPDLAWAHFALGEALSQTGDHAAAVAAFERARAIGLPFRAFWYQFGAYRSMLEIGAYEELISLADETLAPMNGENLEESHYWKGLALLALDRREEGLDSLRRALVYNPRFEAASAALDAAR
jgi:tetratricopeptide (TPR) repeat protein